MDWPRSNYFWEDEFFVFLVRSQLAVTNERRQKLCFQNEEMSEPFPHIHKYIKIILYTVVLYHGGKWFRHLFVLKAECLPSFICHLTKNTNNSSSQKWFDLGQSMSLPHIFSSILSHYLPSCCYLLFPKYYISVSLFNHLFVILSHF